MANKNTRKANMKREKYNFDTLLDDILSSTTEDNEKENSNDIAKREYSSKLVVIQMLINMAESFKTENYKDDKKLDNAIEVKVNGDELLSGYIFFISQNSQFDYSWNAMRKRKANYQEFLTNAVRFFNNVLTDINILENKTLSKWNIHVVFHDVLDVKFFCDEPFVKTSILWNNFYHLAMVKSEYNISIKANESLLKVGCRKKSSDIETLVNSAMEILK